jgi:hypothetical protein
MICPDCGGNGRVRKRFLIFFTRRARCRKCLGTGEFPPPVANGDSDGTRTAVRDDDDRDLWAARGYGAGVFAARDQSGEQDTSRADIAFEVGSGGRSGGGGGGASWGDAAGDDAPVIVDPFASDSAAVSGVVAAEAADAAASGSSDDTSSSDAGETSSTSDETSY